MSIASNGVVTFTQIPVIPNDSIGADQLAANSVVSASIVNGSIVSADIAANTIATSNIADNAIDGTKIASNSILTRHVDDNQITGDQISDNVVLSGTGSMTMPKGTTAQRSGSAQAGMFRYNTTLGKFEGYTDSWGEVGGSGGNGFLTDIFDGTTTPATDGSRVAFTMSQTVSDEKFVMVFIDGVYQAHDAYSVSGSTLTMADAPVAGRVLTVHSISATVSGDGLTINNFSGDGSDTTFTLGINPVHENNTQVYIDGVYQFKNTYSVSGTTLTFSSAPPNGTSIEVMIHSQTAINTFPATGISGLTEVTAVGADHFMIFDATDSALKKALVSDVLDNVVLTSEQAQDIVGAMFTSNTETGLSATYQDADGTIDLVIGDNSIVASMIAENIISARELAANTVATGNIADNAVDGTKIASNSILTRHIDDDQITGDQLADAITVVTSVTVPTIAASSDLTLDAAGDIILDAAGNDIKLLDAGTQIGQLELASGSFNIRSIVQDADILFKGNDGGSTIIPMIIDMSEAGKVGMGIGNNTPDCGLTVGTSANIKQVAITSSSNAVAWDAKAAANAYHVTTENTTFDQPSNPVEGAVISVEIAQGGTARTIAWNTVFEFAASTAPTVTATANKTDIFTFRYNGSVWQEIGRVQNMAQT